MRRATDSRSSQRNPVPVHTGDALFLPAAQRGDAGRRADLRVLDDSMAEHQQNHLCSRARRRSLWPGSLRAHGSGCWRAVLGLLIHRVVSGRFPPQTALLHVGTGLLAFVATHAAMIGWFDFDLLRAFRRSLVKRRNSTRVVARTVWVWQNLVEIAFGAGWCQTVLFAAALTDGVVRWRSGWKLADAPVLLICVSVLAMVGIADAIGVNRGEVIRLWIFLRAWPRFQPPMSAAAWEAHLRWPGDYGDAHRGRAWHSEDRFRRAVTQNSEMPVLLGFLAFQTFLAVFPLRVGEEPGPVSGECRASSGPLSVGRAALLP